MQFDSNPAIVIENGSKVCRAGLCNQDMPTSQFPSVTRGDYKFGPKEITSYCVGKLAMKNQSTHYMKYPVENSVIDDWDAMKAVWRQCFYQEVKIYPQDHPCLLTEPVMNPKHNRECSLQIMFQQFNVPAFYLAPRPVLSLFSSGKTTGVILDSTNGRTDSVPIFQASVLHPSVMRIELSGVDLTQYMKRLIQQLNGRNLSSKQLKLIKEKVCYVAADSIVEKSEKFKYNQKQTAVTLPDGNGITLGSQTFQCPQALFNPSLIGKFHEGFDCLVYESIMRTDLDLRKKMLESIELCGGNTRFPNFAKRLQKEIGKRCSSMSGVDVNVSENKWKEHSIWVGGSILAKLSTFQLMWISNSEYNEEGSRLVHRKCCYL